MLLPLLLTAVPACARQWQLQTDYSGRTFFDNFEFFDQADPTHGHVSYVNSSTAFIDGLAFWTKDDTPGIQAEHWKHTALNEPRKSVRISSRDTFAGGLFIFDVAMFPHGCGVWPALWMLGKAGPWPHGGEIDILENVHSSDANQYALHTAPGCRVGGGEYSGTLGHQDCEGSRGCAIQSRYGTYGRAFNEGGGGVIALLWEGDGLKFWDWSRSSIPGNIGSPRPEEWGRPAAFFSSEECNMWEYFHKQVIILNVDLCGAWAGSTYQSTEGCPGSCEERMMDPANLQDTVMQVNYIRVYQWEEEDGQTGDGLAVQAWPGPGWDNGASRRGVGIWTGAAVVALYLLQAWL